jgi:hypothetical protein
MDIHKAVGITLVQLCPCGKVMCIYLDREGFILSGVKL